MDENLNLEQPFSEMNAVCDKYGMPHVGTTAFNELCRLYFNANIDNKYVTIDVVDFSVKVRPLDYVIVTGKSIIDYWEIVNNRHKQPLVSLLKKHAEKLNLI